MGLPCILLPVGEITAVCPPNSPGNQKENNMGESCLPWLLPGMTAFLWYKIKENTRSGVFFRAEGFRRGAVRSMAVKIVFLCCVFVAPDWIPQTRGLPE